MWIANGWKEYEVIDTSCGEKLERWGKYLLVRPDPQVIWDTPKTEPGWRKMNAHYHRRKYQLLRILSSHLLSTFYFYLIFYYFAQKS